LPLPSEPTKLRMLAFCVDGRMIEDFEYPLAGTPCETVVGQQFRFYPSRLIERFPLDADFRDLAVDAYAGYPLTGAQGKPLGLISVVSRRPFADPELVEAMLKIFATRAVTEIERRRADQALRASEEQYRAIFNASADALVLWDSRYRRVDVNPAYERLYGWSRDEVIGRGYEHPAFSPEYARPRLELVRRALAGETCHAELEAIRRNGERVPTEIHVIPFQHRGEPHVLTIARDITDRKQAEEALRASEAQYRAIFNASADAMMLWNSRLVRVDVNPAHERIFGFARDEVVGRAFEGLPYPEEYVRPRIEMLRRALAGEACRVELDALRRDGQRIVTELRTVPFVHHGEPHVLQIARDITERRRTEEALRASEAQYRAIFNASADALVLRDADFRIVDVNSTYEAWTGITRDQAIGSDRVLANPPGVNERVKALHSRVLNGEAIQLETQLLHRDGSFRELELRGMPIRHRGAPHVLYAGRDITKRKHAEEERARLEGQLRQAQKMEAIGHLTGGIAHDFNNILTGILGYIVLAGERDVAAADPKLGQYLEQARRAALRARDLIQQMLTFSRGRRGEPRPLDLPQVARDALRLIGATLPSSMVVDVDLESEVPAVMADPVQVEQVLLNLLINARDAMHGAGAVVVRSRIEEHAGTVCASCRKPIQGRFVTLAVGDSGSGIAPDVVDRIFDPFYTTKGVGKGSGMGLSMVHGIVHECGGHITVDSTPGDGATFRVLFPPLAEGRADEDRGTSTETVSGRRAPLISGRVLVVDDEPMVGEFMAELLTSRGLAVTLKADPLEALRWYSEDPDRVDLVLTDQTMPRMTGLELAQRLTTERPELSVILCTGYSGDVGAGELRQHGVTALLKKPIEPASLVELLQSHLPRT
ncbi:MAG: PAS domain S-box protein, partial [Betaproteobacteria bacterium]|nr:PAS domain S-box protein [Betaproteobacteria bacterium]